MTLLPVADALSLVLAGVEPIAVERVPLARARGRILAEPLNALRTQPGFDASAMDGYAVQSAGAPQGASLKVVGESAAGHRFAGRFGPDEAVRIFTGAPVPVDADAVLVQELASREGDTIRVGAATRPGQNVRRRGLDFTEGTPALSAGIVLGPRDLALAAAADHATVPVRRRPVVAILATGDEIVAPGQGAGADQVVASNTFALAAIVEAEGGTCIDLGIAGDDFPALEAAIDRARKEGADILATIGGASVGDHDLVQAALRNQGMALGFWRIAMRPGKPMMHGRLGPMHILGLPGNPVSAVVCGILFLVPLLRKMLGRADTSPARRPARFGTAWPANDVREDYLRATMSLDAETGIAIVTPFPAQDSSMVRLMRDADCLLVRPPFAVAAEAGDWCEIVDLRALGY